MSESLMSKKQPDNFTHESPVRAFTEFRVSGHWAIGKGFRPSLAHMHVYLDAMEAKEGWRMVQMLDGGTLDPTLIFHRDIHDPVMPELRTTIRGECDWPMVDAWLKDMGYSLVQEPDGSLVARRYELTEEIVYQTYPLNKEEHPAFAKDFEGETKPGTIVEHYSRVPNVGDDPINPAYYDGTACAEIIEHMPTNVGIAGKYIWRLGEKDAEKQECGKAAWYLHRQLNLDHGWTTAYRSASFFQWYRQMADSYINAAQKAGKLTTWRATAMSALVSYTITGEPSFLHTVIGFLEGKECFSEYGRGMEP